MPTRVSCKECGYVLLNHPTMPDGNYYYDLFNKYSGKCPQCKHPLPNTSHFQAMMEVEVKGAPTPTQSPPVAHYRRKGWTGRRKLE